MGTYILTSMFPDGFNDKISELFRQRIIKRNRFAFVASEFENLYEKTDNYFRFFLNMFEEKDMHFDDAYVVDGRMTAQEAQRAVAQADVVWLSGGDTPTQFKYFRKYGLCSVIKRHKGVIIGMSAGSLNLAQTAICTLSCGHNRQEIYSALGCVDISVEPHFVRSRLSDELIELSKKHMIYGLCDDSVIICTDGKTEFFGEIYRLCGGKIERLQ